LEAIPGLRKDFCEESERGRGPGGGGQRGRFLEARSVSSGDGSSQGLIACGDGFDLHQGTESCGQK